MIGHGPVLHALRSLGPLFGHPWACTSLPPGFEPDASSACCCRTVLLLPLLVHKPRNRSKTSLDTLIPALLGNSGSILEPSSSLSPEDQLLTQAQRLVSYYLLYDIYRPVSPESCSSVPKGRGYKEFRLVYGWLLLVLGYPAGCSKLLLCPL